MRSVFRDDGGAVALYFSLALVPLIIGVGMAIDYGSASQEQARLT